MDIPINVDVFCGGELCGRSKYLVINPVSERITHIVVAEKAFPNIERLVPVKEIRTSTPASIELRCSTTELSAMEPFAETDFIESGDLETELPYEAPYLVWPYVAFEKMPMPLERNNVPQGEIVIRRGTPVRATDGRIGKVDEFLVDPENDNITHLVLREGHLWGEKDVNIPVSEISKIDDEAVYLKLDKDAIAELPAIPVARRWK